VTLPSLSGAATILFTGSSAGAFGLAEHATTVVARYPAATVYGVLDSMFDPAPEVLTPDENVSIDSVSETLWDESVVPAWGGWVEPTCAVQYPTDPWKCARLDNLFDILIVDESPLQALER
jgi:hypothetical protein